jgi:hypothetical protein
MNIGEIFGANQAFSPWKLVENFSRKHTCNYSKNLK